MGNKHSHSHGGNDGGHGHSHGGATGGDAATATGNQVAHAVLKVFLGPNKSDHEVEHRIEFDGVKQCDLTVAHVLLALEQQVFSPEQKEYAKAAEGVYLYSSGTVYSEPEERIVGQRFTVMPKKEATASPSVVEGQPFSITIKTLTGKRVTIECDPTVHKVLDLKLLYQDREGVPPNQNNLVFNGKKLSDVDRFEAAGLTNGCTISSILSLRGATDVFVRKLTGDITLLEYAASDTVGQLKAKYAEKEHVDAATLTFLVNGEVLRDDQDMTAASIDAGSVVTLVLKAG